LKEFFLIPAHPVDLSAIPVRNVHPPERVFARMFRKSHRNVLHINSCRPGARYYSKGMLKILGLTLKSRPDRAFLDY